MHPLTVVALIGVAALAAASPLQNAGSQKVVCYYGSWAVYRHGNGKFDVEQIDPNICTHAIYGFVGLSDQNTVQVMDPYNDEEENWGRGAFKRFTGLKRQNPALKTLIAIGGWNEGSEKYSRMAADPAKRKIFVDSVVPFLQKEGFDGFDVDWEYPANREGAMPEDKENFVLLLNELRAALSPHGYLLTAAVAAGVNTISTAYDIPAVSRALDFINVMAYDFHGAWEKFTGHHSALGANPEIDTGDNILLNSNASIHYWIEKGADPAKLILGMGTYGRGFLLDDMGTTGLYAPAANPINAGPYTGEPGFWGYNELCEKMSQQKWTVVNDAVYQVPYAFSGRQWVGYDSPESIANKARYVKSMGLGGAMFWSVDTDDFKGLYHSEKFPLVRAAYRELLGNGSPPPPPPVETEAPATNAPPQPTEAPVPTRVPTAAPQPTPEPTQAPLQPPPSTACTRRGLNPDPARDCSPIFVSCEHHDGKWSAHQQSCHDGLVFNPNGEYCDWPANVAECSS